MRSPIVFLFLSLSAQAAEVTLHRWSGTLNVPDPVACTVDERGHVYVAATTRRKVGDLDIREHQMWIADDVGLSSVEEKRAFLQRELAPGKLRVPRGSLKDHNKDGSIDWKDLTVHSERIYQLRDTDGDGTADKMTTFAEGFNTEVTGIAAGILYHDGWVYATIAPDLWRLKDTDDDGVADVREVVATGFGMHIAYAGHDMHGPRLGPDGRIYWSIGDKGLSVTSKEGKKWHYPNEGAVMRVEPDGSGFEVFAHGLRNVQEVAFDVYGNMFGVDNDADMPGEKERFVCITEQSDSGWRCAHQYMKTESRWMREGIWDARATHPHFITPPLANYSNGPAGFIHEPGTALGESLRNHFILDQFPSGKMEAFTITPKGSAFAMSKARLVHSGIMGIGLSFGPEGELYLADWVGGYPLDEKGAIWRTKSAPSAARAETQKVLSSGFSKREIPELQDLLGHADQRVRLGAQLELASRKAWPALAEVALNSKAPALARIHALWGYGIGLRREGLDDKALQPLLSSDDTELQTQLCKIFGDAPTSVGEASKAAITGWLASASERVRFHAAIATGKLELSGATGGLWAMAAKDAKDAWLRHAVVTGLAGALKADPLAAKLKVDSADVRLAATLALARQHSPLISTALEDADSVIVDEAARAIHDDVGIPEALPALAKLVNKVDSLSEVTARRVINAQLRLGNPAHAQQLADIALTSTKPALAQQALAALVLFTTPPRLDLVDGVARTYEPRDRSAIATALQPKVDALLALQNADLKSAAIQLMVALELKVAAPALREIVADTKAKSNLRASALRLMAAQHASDASFTETLTLAAAKSAPEELRRESLLQTFQHQPALAIPEAARVLEQGSLKEKQQALKLLAKEPEKPEAAKLAESWLTRLAAGKVEPGLKLDVLEASQAFPSLAEKLTSYQQSRATAPRDDLLEGGDSTNGRDIVTNHLGANCIACHIVEAKEGSQVGPPLTTVGGVRSRSELLESLLNPVAKIVPGYGFVSVTLKDGSSLAGALAKEDKAAVTLRLADGTEKKLTRTQIAMQTPPVSMMPPMLGILTPSEIRDVVSYLSGLKPKKK